MQKVSVILPNYNHEKFLKKRIDSILNQTYQNFELIILDDASIDDSLLILNQYKRHPKVSQFICNKKNSGSPFIQWKRGIDLAKGDLIWIAESDDFCTNDFLMETVGFMNNNPQVSLVFVNSTTQNLINNTEKIIQTNKVTKVYSDSSDNFLFNWFFENSPFRILNASSCIFKKNDIDLVILNKTQEFKFGGDKLFWTSLILNNKPFGFINKTINFHTFHNHTTRSRLTLKRNAQRNRELLYIYEYADFLNLKNVTLGWRIETGSRLILSFVYGIMNLDGFNIKNLVKGIKVSKLNKMVYYKVYRGVINSIGYNG